MKQSINIYKDNKSSTIFFPSPNDEVVDGVKWGFANVLFTPAYWKLQIMYYKEDLNQISLKKGETLNEEIISCLLGGYGMKAEVGTLFFNELKSLGAIGSKEISEEKIYEILKTPLIHNNKKYSYRYPKQKSKYVFNALTTINNCPPPINDINNLRSWLMNINGIGPKTASWIIRNWFGCEDVAIIDIHIFKAGALIGLFNNKEDISKEYFNLESKFIKFAKGLMVKPSELDTIIWQQARQFSSIIKNILTQQRKNICLEEMAL
jgi:N-glycosylase/DNA lyase